MRNLKRVLSLAMASIMLVGMMVVGASAVDFPDSDKIENTDAVNTLVSLGIIKGKDDGTFDPEGIVTRAEMAKMICVALNKGKDPNLSGGGVYPDTVGHWASGYIDYCSNLGIVSGDNTGKFNPNNTVTAVEAAKMILIAIGYDAEAEGFVNNAKWDTNIGIRASERGLYEDLAIVPMEGLTRDNAAQMIWNGLQATMVVYDYKLNTVNGDLVTKAIAQDKTDKNDNPITLLKDRFDMETEYSYLTGISYDSKKTQYTYSFSNTGLSNKLGATITGNDALTPASLKSDKDFSDLYGMKVKVLYKNDDNKTVYGIYADSKVLAAGTWGDVDEKDDSIKFDDETFKKDANYNAMDYNTGKVATTAKEYTFKAIDNNDDGKVDVTVILPLTVVKVTFVGKDAITAGGKSYDFDDCDIYDDVAKDDYVTIVDAANTKNDTTVISAVEVLEGSVGAVKTGEIRVDGTWYKYATTTVSGTDTPTAGDDVKLQLVNGFVAHAKIVEGTASLENVLYVVKSSGTANNESATDLGGNLKGDDTLVLLADGTKTTVKAARVDTYKTSGTVNSDNLVETVPATGMYTYKVNKNSIYELKAVKAATTDQAVGSFYVANTKNLPGSTTLTAGVSSGYTKDAKKLDSKFIADDAVIYLVTTNSGYEAQKVISGKELKGLSTYGDGCSYLSKKVSGLDTIQVAVITDSTTTDKIPGTSDGTGYGYVTGAGYAEKNSDGDWVVKFTVWDGSDDVVLTATDADNTDVSGAEFAEGAFVEYTKSTTEGEVTDVKTTGDAVAITGYNGDKAIAFDEQAAVSLKDDDKTVIIGVNTADVKGVAGPEIVTATEVADHQFIKNAVVVMDGDKVAALFIDTANKLTGAEYDLAFATNDPAAVSGVDVSGYTVTKANDSSISTGDDIAAGSTVKVVVAGSGTATANVTITVTVTLADTTTIVKTLSVAKDATFSGGTVTFEMPDQAVTGIAVTVA